MWEKEKPESLTLLWPLHVMSHFLFHWTATSQWSLLCEDVLKFMGWTPACVWPHLSCKSQQLIQLRLFHSSEFSRPVGKTFSGGLAPILTYSPFTSTPSSTPFTLITRPPTCQEFRSDFKSIRGRLILKRLCWTETTLLLRKLRLHSSQCNYRARHFPAAWRWTYREGYQKTRDYLFSCFHFVKGSWPDLHWRLSDLQTQSWTFTDQRSCHVSLLRISGCMRSGGLCRVGCLCNCVLLAAERR